MDFKLKSKVKVDPRNLSSKVVDKLNFYKSIYGNSLSVIEANVALP